MLGEDVEELAENVISFVIELLQLLRAEDDVEGEPFVEVGFVADIGIDDKLITVAVAL